MRNSEQLVIIGAGGHGRVAADVARQMGYEKILFLDDNLIPGVEGKTETYTQYLNCADFFVAIGNSEVREKYIKKLRQNSAKIASLIHPKAAVAENVIIGTGSIVMAGAVVNTSAVLGDGVIINTCASVDHDCRIDDYVHVAVGAHICGTVEIGAHTWLGAGATVINNVRICGGCMIGAGAVVVREITNVGTYLGIPAKKSKSNNIR